MSISPNNSDSTYLRAAGYFRVSTSDQAGERHVSLPVQIERFHRLCAERRWVSAGEYQDIASGRKDARKEYQRMLTDVRAGGIGAVVVQFLDRFGRNPREILRRVWELQDLGVEVVVTDEDIKEELMLLLRAGFAGRESERTSERVKATMERVVADGRWPGRDPFGYILVRDPEARNRGKLLVNEAEAPIVQRIFGLYIGGDVGFAMIAGILNAERVPSPSQKDTVSGRGLRHRHRRPSPSRSPVRKTRSREGD